MVERVKREQAALESERAVLRARLPVLASLLRRHGAIDVLLFGSLAWGGFRSDSDVDVAVSGLDYVTSLDAMAAAGRLLDRPVEVFRLEDLPESFRERILRDGERL